MNTGLQNKAWHILPKEFKEEVKYEYNRVATKARKDEYDLGFMHAHEGIFGLHNLTSDAEGEDEMLCVSRKNVQRMYSYNEEELTKDPTNKGALLLKLRLDALFGSKCLPYETKNGAKDRAKEPKPAGPKKKRHVSVKEACEILGVDESEATTLVKSKPIETCTDDCSSPDHFVVKDEMVDNIIKDGFKNHNRLHIAAMAMAGLLANPNNNADLWETVADALDCADALIAKSEKGGSK